MEKKFKILRIVATIWKVIAWIVLVVSVLGGCGSLVFGLMGAAPAVAAEMRWDLDSALWAASSRLWSQSWSVSCTLFFSTRSPKSST
jgi:hypothetical protein